MHHRRPLASHHALQFAGGTPRSLRLTTTSLAATIGQPVRKMLQSVADIAVGHPVDITLASEESALSINNHAALAPTIPEAFAASRLEAVKPLLGGATGPRSRRRGTLRR